MNRAKNFGIFLMALVGAFLLVSFAIAQTQQTPLPPGMEQFVDGNGAPYAGGKLYMYYPTTSTPKVTYKDPAGLVANTNPIVLDANGRAIIWGTGLYRQVLQDSLGNLIWDQQTYGVSANSVVGSTLCASTTSTGSANAQILSPSPSVTSLVTGAIYCGIAGFTNTSTMTLQISTLGFQPVKKQSSGGLTILTGGEVVVGQGYLYEWDGAEFQLINPTNTAGTVSAETTFVSPGFCAYNLLDGTHDTTSCVQAAVNAACSNTLSPTGAVGGVVEFSKGQYYIAGSVGIPAACSALRLVGQSMGSWNDNSSGTTIVSGAGCSGPIFNFYSDATSNYVHGGGVEWMKFFNSTNGDRIGSGSCTAYPLIRASYGYQMNFLHLYSWLPNQMIQLIHGEDLLVEDVFVEQALQDSPGVFEFYGTGASSSSPTEQQTRQDYVAVSDVFMGASSGFTAGHKLFTGIWWHGFSQTLSLKRVAMEVTTVALKIDCSGGFASDISACPGFLNSLDLEAEGAGGNLIDASDFQYLRMFNTYMHCFDVSQYGGCNDSIKLYNNLFSKTYSATFVGGQADSAQHSCLDAEMQGLVVTGMSFFGCNAGNTGGTGVSLEPQTGSDLSGNANITNNLFCNLAGSAPTSMTAILISTGLDYILANGNNFYLCNAGIQNSSVGTHIVTSPNVGP